MITYYTASWCPTCKQMLPKIQKECSDAGVPLRVLDVDEHEEQAKADKVFSLPSISFEPGMSINAAHTPLRKLREMIESHG